MKYGRKFWMSAFGLLLTAVVTLMGKMDANVAMCITVCVGGYAAGNTLVSRAALQSGQDSPNAPEVIT